MSGMTFGTGAGGANAGAEPAVGLSGETPSPSPHGNGPDHQTERQRALVKESHKFYERASKWESTFRAHFVDDLKFDAADSYNNYQWPNSVRRLRDIDDRPCLTINKTKQHNLQIINDAKQNKSEPRIRPTGGEATFESAQIFEGLQRHILYQSKFSTIQDMAVGFQVRAGFGVYRVVTDFAGDDSMDQDIFIRPIPDPLSVLFDPDAKLPDKSDGRRAMIFDNIPKDEFKDIYPEYSDYIPGRDVEGGAVSDWIGEDHVRICEYFYKVAQERRLVRFTDPQTGEEHQVDLKEIPQELLHTVLDNPMTRQRSVVWNEVHRAVIVGDCVVEENVWLGRIIPLIPVIGEESVIDGIMDRKGHTRALIDPQRMYNYWSSAAVEFGALQTKSPWIAPVAAIEGHEETWNTANKQNTSVLPWNHFDEDGQPVPKPERPQLPEQAPLFLSGMQSSQQEMMMVSGQYQTQMGMQGNERSGKAIQERQRQGDNATYHFIDNQAIAVRLLGEILLELIPKVYNTPRVLQTLALDGKTSIPVRIDPQAAQAYQQTQAQDGEIVERVFNPRVGKYDVQADIGPAYATRRQEAFSAMTQILTQAPEMTSVIGDILLKNADFPGAEEAAQRLLRMVPPQALGKGPSQAEQALQQELQKTTGALTAAMQETAKLQLKLTGKSELRDVDVYKAETERFAALGKVGMVDPESEQFKTMVQQLISDALATHLAKVSGETESAIQPTGTQPMPISGGVPQ